MSGRQHGQEGTEGRDTVDLCRARLTASVLCSLKHVPEKSYKVSEALGTEAGLLRPTQEAHISVSSYTRTCKAVFSGTVHHHARQSRCWGLLAKPSDATTVRLEPSLPLHHTTCWASPCSWNLASKETQKSFWPEFVVKLLTSFNSH